MPEPLRVLLVDDHPLFRKGLRALLATLPQVAVVGEAANRWEATTLAQELQPDWVRKCQVASAGLARHQTESMRLSAPILVIRRLA